MAPNEMVATGADRPSAEPDRPVVAPDRPVVAPDRPSAGAMAWQTAIVTLAVSCGLLAGALYGATQPVEYRTTYRFRVDEALQIDHWSVSLMAANFGVGLSDPATREAAGDDQNRLGGIHSLLVDGSSLVAVWTETTEPDGAADQLTALTNAALVRMINQEHQAVAASLATQAAGLEELDSSLASLYARAGLVDDADLADELDEARRLLVAKQAQLEVVAPDDSYNLTRTAGEIAELEDYIGRLEPVAAEWQTVAQQHAQLDEATGQWRQRMIELDAAREIVASGSAADTVLVEPKSRREVVGRNAAIGGGLAALAGLGVMLFRSLRP